MAGILLSVWVLSWGAVEPRPSPCEFVLKVIESPLAAQFSAQISDAIASRSPNKIREVVEAAIHTADTASILLVVRKLAHLDFRKDIDIDQYADLIAVWNPIVQFASLHFPLEFETALKSLENKLSDFYFYMMLQAPHSEAVDCYFLSENVRKIAQPFWAILPGFQKWRDANSPEIQE